jgi:hypothetical protein
MRPWGETGSDELGELDAIPQAYDIHIGTGAIEDFVAYETTDQICFHTCFLRCICHFVDEETFLL